MTAWVSRKRNAFRQKHNNYEDEIFGLYAFIE
jgi:hypothetical protein